MRAPSGSRGPSGRRVAAAVVPLMMMADHRQTFQGNVMCSRARAGGACSSEPPSENPTIPPRTGRSRIHRRLPMSLRSPASTTSCTSSRETGAPRPPRRRAGSPDATIRESAGRRARAGRRGRRRSGQGHPALGRFVVRDVSAASPDGSSPPSSDSAPTKSSESNWRRSGDWRTAEKLVTRTTRQPGRHCSKREARRLARMSTRRVSRRTTSAATVSRTRCASSALPASVGLPPRCLTAWARVSRVLAFSDTITTRMDMGAPLPTGNVGVAPGGSNRRPRLGYHPAR